MILKNVLKKFLKEFNFLLKIQMSQPKNKLKWHPKDFGNKNKIKKKHF
jgi:hypothetical protein